MQNQVAEIQTDQTAPTAATVASPDASMQTTPTPSPAAPMPEPAAAPLTNKATHPTDSPKSRPLPEGWAPRFWPEILHREFHPSDKPTEDVVAEDTVQLDYEIVLRGGREEVVRVKSQIVLPMALEVENLAQTDVSFPALFDQIIVRPLVTKFRGFLQKRFDAASAAEAKKRSAVEPPPTPSHPANNVKLPKPANGVSYPMPAIEAKLPTARMPGSHPNLKP
jgi:hypothetical protein